MLRHRLVDLLRADRLVAHPLVDRLEALAQAVHLLDDLAGLAVDLGDRADAGADLLGELVHLHDAGRHRVLHVPDHVLDVERRHRGLVGQPADLPGHHQEAAAVLAGLLRLDGRVDRQQVRLVGHLGDRGHHDVDVVGLLADGGQLAGDRRRSIRPAAASSPPCRPAASRPAAASAAAWLARSLTSFMVPDSSLLVAVISRTAAAISCVELRQALHGRVLLARRGGDLATRSRAAGCSTRGPCRRSPGSWRSWR